MRKFLRVIALLLVLTTLCGTASCAYRSKRSSREEREIVFTVANKYEVKYELYRFAFLSELMEYTYQNKDKWDAQMKNRYFKLCDTAAREEVSRVYALFALCEEYGIDPYGRAVDKEVKARVKDAFYNEQTGYGDRKTYLKALYDANMNDSVFRLYLRYAVCEKLLADAMHAAGFVPEDNETVLNHYYGDATVCATWIYIPYEVLKGSYDDDKLNALVLKAQAADLEGFLKMTHEHFQPLYTDAELDTGFYFGKTQLDDYYSELVEASFALKEGKTSGLVHSGDGAYIIRRLPKDHSYISNPDNMEYLRECYLLNEFYRVLNEKKLSLIDTIEVTEFYKTLNIDNVEMPVE